LVPFWPEPDSKKWPNIWPTGYPVHPYPKHGYVITVVLFQDFFDSTKDEVWDMEVISGISPGGGLRTKSPADEQLKMELTVMT